MSELLPQLECELRITLSFVHRRSIRRDRKNEDKFPACKVNFRKLNTVVTGSREKASS